MSAMWKQQVYKGVKNIVIVFFTYLEKQPDMSCIMF